MISLQSKSSERAAAAAAAKSIQSCPTLCNRVDGSPPGSPFPGILQAKPTRVGCHFLLQCIKVKSESEVAQSCPTLSDPMDCSPPGSSVHGIFQARVLEWVAIAFSTQKGQRRRKKILAQKTWVLGKSQSQDYLQMTKLKTSPVAQW